MNLIRQTNLALAAILMCFAAGPEGATGMDDLAFRRSDRAVVITAGTRPVLEYRYAGVPFKPYVAKLFSPDGVQILRDSPSDHKHHHGLMFGVSVDGVDFWAEDPVNGSQKSQNIGQSRSVVGKDLSRAGFVEHLQWIEPEKDSVVLAERRSIEVGTAKQPRPVTLLTWRSRLSVPPGKDAVELTGESYFGLGMRFVTSMDRGGRFFSSARALGDVIRRDQRLTAARWCAYTAQADGKPVTVAILDHPDNPRHPAKMFTMTQRFAYLSATLNLWKEPMRLAAAAPLDLCYGVALWDGAVDPADVESLYQSWAAATALRQATGQ